MSNAPEDRDGTNAGVAVLRMDDGREVRISSADLNAALVRFARANPHVGWMRLPPGPPALRIV